MTLRRWGLLVGGILFFWVLRSVDLAAVWEQVRSFHWRFGLIAVFYGIVFGLDTLGWRYALNPQAQSQVRWDRLFRTRLAGEAVNYVTPAAWVGGEPVKAYLLLKRHGIPLADGMASVVVAKTTFVLSMLLFIVVGLLITVGTHSLSGSLMKWVGIVLPVVFLLFAGFTWVQFYRPFHWTAGALRWMAPGWFRTMGHKIHEWDSAIVSFYRKFPRAVLWSLAFHGLGWMAGIVEVYLILKFLHLPVSWATAWSIEALWVLLKAGAFLIPGTLGASEGFLLLICAGFGINAVTGLALALIRRARELLWVGLGLVEFSRG